MDISGKLFLNALEVAALLNEGKTVFNSEHGSRKDPRFPAPVRRPGRKDAWYRPDVDKFAQLVAEAAHAGSTERSPGTASPPSSTLPAARRASGGSRKAAQPTHAQAG